MSPFTSLDLMPGRAVQTVMRLDDEKVLVVFADGSHALLRADRDTGDLYGHIQERAICLWQDNISREDAVRVGLCTGEEYDDILNKRAKETREAHDRSRRLLYEQLKKEFG